LAVQQFGSTIAMDPFRVMVEAVYLFIRDDMRFHKKGTTYVVHADIGFCQPDLTGANGFDFAALQCQYGLETPEEKIFKTNCAVVVTNLTFINRSCLWMLFAEAVRQRHINPLLDSDGHYQDDD
jgi:hypothetical protein